MEKYIDYDPPPYKEKPIGVFTDYGGRSTPGKLSYEFKEISYKRLVIAALIAGISAKLVHKITGIRKDIIREIRIDYLAQHNIKLNKELCYKLRSLTKTQQRITLAAECIKLGVSKRYTCSFLGVDRNNTIKENIEKEFIIALYNNQPMPIKALKNTKELTWITQSINSKLSVKYSEEFVYRYILLLANELPKKQKRKAPTIYERLGIKR